MMRSRVINTIGFICTGAVLIVVLVTKFMAGAWIAIVAMSALFVLMRPSTGTTRRSPGTGQAQESEADDIVLPSRNHAVVLVSKLHLPTLRALSLRQGHPARRAGGHHRQRRRRRDPAAGAQMGGQRHQRAAEGGGLAVPRGDPARAGLRQTRISKEAPRTVVTVFIPNTWWVIGGRQLLHNQSALRLKTSCCSCQQRHGDLPVPWQLTSPGGCTSWRSTTRLVTCARLPGVTGTPRRPCLQPPNWC